jgi:hypothetical protein
MKYSAAIITTYISLQHASLVAGFVAPSRSLLVNPIASKLNSAVAADDVTGLADLADQKAWDCDEEANCVQIEACDEVECRTTLDVRIHGDWYDLSGK